MLVRIAAYATVFAVFALIELPFLPLTASLVFVIRKAKALSAPLTVLLSFAKICVAVLLSGWLLQRLGWSPAWLMFLIPGWLMVQNGLTRIAHVRAGRSNVKRMLEQCGEPESYDIAHDLWIERSYLLGDLLGWIVGTCAVLQPARFF